MPHIHTGPNQIDYTVCIFIVYKNKVLLRLHDKHNLWLAPGGHIELYEDPVAAALREVKEEVGMDVKIWSGNQLFKYTTEKYLELVPPVGLNIHSVKSDHRHTELVYFATADTDRVVEPETEERSGGIWWITKEELIADPSLEESTRQYSLRALEVLGA